MKIPKSISQFYILLILQISAWFFSIFLCKYYLTSSKYRYYEPNFNNYIVNLHKQENDSIEAKKNLRQWVREAFPSKQIKSFFKNPNQLTQSNKYVCVGILSKNRINSQLNYVNKAVMSVITRLPFEKWKDVSIIGFNLEYSLDFNRNLLDLSDLIHIVNISSNIDHREPKVKETMDYALVLNELYTFNCKYSLIIEDDSIISHDWYSRIKDSIDYINVNNKLDDWMCTKLFSGYKFYDIDLLYDPLIVITCILKSLIFSIFQILLFNIINNVLYLRHSLLKNFKRFKLIFLKSIFLVIENKRTKYYFIISYSLIIINSFLIIFWFKLTSINPVDTNNIRDFSARFGTVAVLYPYHQLLPFSQYLKNELREYLYNANAHFLPKDLSLFKYKQINNLKEFTMEPSLVQHTGLHSSLHNIRINEKAYNNLIRSYSFTDENKPVTFETNFLDNFLNG
jgi:hypothetical protein